MTNRDITLSDSDPTLHYDSVVDAWAYLLEDDLHYGYFAEGGESLTMATDALTNEMMELAGLSAATRVLDIGCGTGRAACRLATETGCTVVGISPSRTCVQRSRERAASMDAADRLHFLSGDGMLLPHPEQAFDVVWVMESSHLMEDKSRLLHECSRVLAPGGRVVLCDITLARKLALEEVIDHRDDFLLLKDVYGRARMEPLSFYESQLQALGLETEHSRNIARETRPTFGHWRANAQRHSEQVIESIGASAQSQFVASCDVLEKFWDLDILRYGILSAVKPA